MATKQRRRGGNRRSNATVFDFAEAGSGDGSPVNLCRALNPSTIAELPGGILFSAYGTGECKGGGRWADDCLFGGMDMRLGSLYQVRLREVG
nr:hypothetical protein Iba_chr07bCG9390 [Ipomoea batatas]